MNCLSSVMVFSFSTLAGHLAAEHARSSLALYDPDPEHLWNRLHAAVFIRTAPEGTEYGQDRLDPLLWPGTKHLLEGESHQQAIKLFNEFVRERGEKLVQDPLKRALLQRDLWALFDWLVGDHHSFAGQPIRKGELREAQERLRGPVAEAIRSLALTSVEIGKLPDNYAAAVRSGIFAGEYDPGKSTNVFLPPKLFDPDGPWVCVGRPDGAIAPVHVAGNNGFTRSVFLTFLRLPRNRKATLQYLERLRAFDKDTWVEVEKGDRRGVKFLPNPELPQFPAGTQVAFVRRMMLIDLQGRVRATGVTESVQLRVYRKIPDMTVQSFEDALVSGTRGNRLARQWQDFYEFQLSREGILSGRAGGLRAIRPDERDFHTGLNAHPTDELEMPVLETTKTIDDRRSTVLQTCFACHSLPGVYSLDSHFFFRGENPDQRASRHPAVLSSTTPDQSSPWYCRNKERLSDWQLLKMLITPR